MSEMKRTLSSFALKFMAAVGTLHYSARLMPIHVDPERLMLKELQRALLIAIHNVSDEVAVSSVIITCTYVGPIFTSNHGLFCATTMIALVHIVIQH